MFTTMSWCSLKNCDKIQLLLSAFLLARLTKNRLVNHKEPTEYVL